MVVASPPTPLGVALARVAFSLHVQSLDAKRAVRFHRKRGVESRAALDQLVAYAKSVGVELSIEGEAEGDKHGPVSEAQRRSGS